MNTEQENTKEIQWEDLGSMGYGNEAATIKYEQNKGTEAQAAFVERFIENREGLVDVTEKDDGCIDGRKTLLAYLKRGAEFVKDKIDSFTKQRAKVAGGGFITGLAIRLGISATHEETAEQDLAELGLEYTEKGVFCGAHTGPHAHEGDTTDCGANDRIAEILGNAHTYRGDIDAEDPKDKKLAGTTAALLARAGLEFKPDVFNKVIDTWQTVATDTSYFGGTGETRLNTIRATQEAVAANEEEPVGTRELEGNHKEAYIIVNYVKGKTFNQAALYEALHTQFPDTPVEELPQAFVVDAWRVADLAEATAKNDEEKEAAVYAGVIFQLATAATLTDGSMRVFAYTK